ncbi:MAG: hypothetical protein ACYTDY_06415 [Planctomycetota bacterium]
MSELLWILPILVAVALILGTCRGESLGKILAESSLSLVRLTVGIVIVCVVLQALLLGVLRVF